ncbi:MAG: CBS domain-containing protein [Euryarchaeota archaeon]|jgi:predicted transcriptional regulator|nr:CBS domain-containing protein [Euryarchaeota archaeon]HNS24687.1 CBS domain-containing protein [Methanobacteriaceae archaeon]
MSSSALVKDYMTRKVITVTPDTSNEEVIELMKATGHDGFPVKTNGKVTGMVTAFDLVLKPWLNSVSEIMSTDVVVADQEMSISDASRVMFRMGISRLPVMDGEGHLVGIITNTDIVRSHIERSTPMKVKYFQKTLEQLYDIKTSLIHKTVPIDKLRPTQDRIYADELQGRTYELQMGLAEPTIVVETGDRFVLVDGHHRTVAARKLGYQEIDSYVIKLDRDLKLGMEKTADKNGIFSLDDVQIIDDAQHPLIAITTSLRQESDNKDKNED